jgi:hypothetical protein
VFIRTHYANQSVLYHTCYPHRRSCSMCIQQLSSPLSARTIDVAMGSRFVISAESREKVSIVGIFSSLSSNLSVPITAAILQVAS